MQQHPTELPLYSKGEIVAHTLVDPWTYLWAQEYHWHLNEGYAARSQRRGPDNKPFRFFLHREVVGLKHRPRSEGIVDHINGKILDNRRENLRIVTESENAQNRLSHRGSTSRHKGVHWYEPGRGRRSGWRVQIMVDGKRTMLGIFDDELKAAEVARNFYEKNHPNRPTALRSQGA